MNLKSQTLFLLTVLTILLPFSALTNESDETNIIYISDLPLMENSVTGDYRNLSSLLTFYRNKPSDTFFLFGGGSIGPSPMSSFDKGSHIIDILNTLEPDAMGLTKREFIYSEDELSLRANEAAFPIVGTNLFDPTTNENLNGILSNAIIKKRNLTIGVLSLVKSDVVEEYLIKRMKVLPYRETLEKNAKVLRKKGADLVVLLYSNPSKTVNELLHDNTLDIAFMTDTDLSSAKRESFTLHPNHYFLEDQGKAIIVNAKSLGKDNFKLENTKTSLKIFPHDEVVTSQVATYTKRLNRLLDTEIVKINAPMDTTKIKVRSSENEFANLVADAMRDFSNSDIGFINGGVIRGNKTYTKGSTLTRRDIATELPFRSRIVILEVTGEQLQDAIVNGFSQIQDLKGRFPHFSGVSLTLNSQGVVDLDSIKVNDKPLKLDKKYSLATSDYIAAGGDGFISLKNSPQLSSGLRVTPLLSEVLISYLRSLATVTPSLEQRIVVKKD